MATSTTNYNLSKPSYSDTADIAVINENMDKIDTAIKGISDAVSTNATNISALQQSVSRKTGAISFLSSMSDYGSLAEKSGKYVHVTIAAHAVANMSAWTAIATLPSGFRPPRDFRALSFVNGTLGTINISSNGSVTTSIAISNDAYCFAEFSFADV